MLTKKPAITLNRQAIGWLVLAALIGQLASGCSRTPSRYSQDQDGFPVNRLDISRVPDAVPKIEPRSKYGNPESYEVRGRRYHTLASSKGYKERGIASWYGTKFHGFRTSSGEIYDMYRMSAAHKTLPLPTYARVTNLDNGRSVVVKVNDRGPFHSDRLIDLSYAAASKLGLLHKGTGRVEVEAIDATQQPAASVKVAAVPAAHVLASRPKYAPGFEAPATPAPTVAGPDQSSLYLQLGAFRNKDNALRMQSSLASSQVEGVRIMEGISDQHPVFRVRVGPLNDFQAAETLARRLQDKGLVSSPHIVID
jgi:rare lipoprotein A